MHKYYIVGLSRELGAEVRATMRSPQYGHPALLEVARGTGPCRICLERFQVGAEERILFTHQQPVDGESLGAPGPVFIHARECAQYRGTTFPADLVSLPIILEGRASANRVLRAIRVNGSDADAAIEQLLADDGVDYVFIRHGEAGCFIARVDRGPLPADVRSDAELASVGG